MADLVYDGFTRVSWVPSIANINAPTTSELNAGTALQDRITPDGLKIEPSTATVDTSNVASTFSTSKGGRVSFDASVTLKRQDGTDTLFQTTLRKGQTGYLVVRRNIASSTAWASAQRVEVYPSECGEPALASPAPNEVQRYTVQMFVTSDPATNSAVA
jgi:hypothetical protein